MSGNGAHLALRLVAHLVSFVKLYLDGVEGVINAFLDGLAHGVELLVKLLESLVAVLGALGKLGSSHGKLIEGLYRSRGSR